MTFAEITKDFLKRHKIEKLVKCAYVHYITEYMFIDIHYKPDEDNYIILKEDYTKEELKKFWKDMKFDIYDGNVVLAAFIWLKNDNDFAYFDTLHGKEWERVIAPKIPEECKRSIENGND